ncbi:MAG: hypothetical protein J2P57_23755 [Acidimicrobiaceae bacterium]|nr:hypothetical protein [Acidimicrobiaceae bacterium]
MSGERVAVTLDTADIAVLHDLLTHRLSVGTMQGEYAEHLLDLRNRLVDAVNGEPAPTLFDQDADEAPPFNPDLNLDASIRVPPGRRRRESR